MLPMTLPTPHEDLVSERIGDELAPVDLETNEIFGLNPTGVRSSELLVDCELDRRFLE
jgi:hypothetical protein